MSFFECKASRESSPVRASERALHYRNENGYSNIRPYENGNGTYLQNGHISTTDHSDDEYIDTVEVINVFIYFYCKKCTFVLIHFKHFKVVCFDKRIRSEFENVLKLWPKTRF